MQKTIPIYFAPIQGYTEAIYRNAHAVCFGGIDTYYAPFTRLEKGNFRNKDIREIEPEKNQVPHLIPQLIAPTQEKAETILSLFIEKGYKEADINLGCPFPVLAKKHNGSGILPYPEEVKALLNVVSRHPEISFSVKMRLGWKDPNECMALVDILNDTPLRQITLHSRLGKQQYKGDLDLEGFNDFYEACKHPLVYNGGVGCLEEIQLVREHFPKVAGIMLGRGLLGRPALALEYKENRELPFDELLSKLKAMHTIVYNEYAALLEGGDAQLFTKMKSYWEYQIEYLSLQTDRKLLKAIHKSSNLNKYQQAVSAFFSQAGTR